jgi:glycerol-3-phosphate acyltransferase PlsX
VRIALDAMGSDAAPRTEVAGALLALKDLGSDVTILLVGERAAIEAEIEAADATDRDGLQIVHAPDRITSSDSPASAVRRKPESSIAVGLRLQQDGKADAFVSAGSTGAVMAGSLLLLDRLPGVDRPAIGTMIPTVRGPILMLDAGANVDCKPQHLVQFAKLGNIYAKDLMGLERPRVGLLNIGEEAAKGNEVSLETYAILSESELEFVGNVEGSDIIRGTCDVLVCDGFVGNVLLKFYESVAAYLIRLLRSDRKQGGRRERLEEIVRVLA